MPGLNGIKSRNTFTKNSNDLTEIFMMVITITTTRNHHGIDQRTTEATASEEPIY